MRIGSTVRLGKLNTQERVIPKSMALVTKRRREKWRMQSGCEVEELDGIKKYDLVFKSAVATLKKGADNTRTRRTTQGSMIPSTKTYLRLISGHSLL